MQSRHNSSSLQLQPKISPLPAIKHRPTVAGVKLHPRLRMKPLVDLFPHTRFFSAGIASGLLPDLPTSLMPRPPAIYPQISLETVGNSCLAGLARTQDFCACRGSVMLEPRGSRQDECSEVYRAAGRSIAEYWGLILVCQTD